MSRCIHVYSFVARNHGGIPFSGVCPLFIFSERAVCWGVGGGGCAARLFVLFAFPCLADHEQRDWPSCKVVLFRLATSTLDVRNNNNNIFPP